MWKYQEIQTRVCDKEREKTEKYDLLRQNFQIMANKKGRCDSHCSWSIKNYKNKVREVY